jgi:hypothetical protein
MTLHWDQEQPSEMFNSFDIIVASDWYGLFTTLLFLITNQVIIYETFMLSIISLCQQYPLVVGL